MATVSNAWGVPLAYSATSTNHISATGAGPELYGTAGHDSFWGDSSVNATMYGGTGDDIYYLYSPINRALEAPAEGVDTVATWMSYTLADNFENLIVTGDGSYAFGNALDNIIRGKSGQQTLDGGLGDDVLIGGAGSDIFIFNKGNGSDLIVDFEPVDTVRLNGFGFTSFDAVQARMVQSGADVRLDVGGGEILVFANKTIDQLDASQFELPLDKSGMRLSFADEFDTLSLWNGDNGTWDSNFWWGAPNGSTIARNGELQWYIDTDFGPTSAVNPFSVENGVLTITAAKAPGEIRPYIADYEYTSGLLTSYESFEQTYGYFEIRADMPDGQGMWPAFWLLPADGSWPPELDVIEMKSQEQNTLIHTVHTAETGNHTMINSTVNVSGTEGFHTYGVLWTEDEIVWYFDDIAVSRAETPADMHDPMYMLVNLAVGGIAGTPDASQDTLGEIQIDYIHAYALDALHSTPMPEPEWAL